MKVLIVLTLISVVYSWFVDKEKTKQGLRTGLMMFLNILPIILVVIALLSVTLYF